MREDTKEPGASYGRAGGSRGSPRQNKAPRRGWKCKQLGGLQERLCEELRHPPETGPPEGIFVQLVQVLQRGRFQFEIVKGLSPVRRRLCCFRDFLSPFQDLAK